jgi:hypothetical protein
VAPCSGKRIQRLRSVNTLSASLMDCVLVTSESEPQAVHGSGR